MANAFEITYTMKMHFNYGSLIVFLALSGCGQSQQFVAVPAEAKAEGVPREIVQMKAERFKFVPDLVRVKAGTLVQIKITSVEGTHGFQLGAFGIDERIDENETKTIKFYASEKGEYSFRCSHFCGIGHLGMNGKVLVE